MCIRSTNCDIDNFSGCREKGVQIIFVSKVWKASAQLKLFLLMIIMMWQYLPQKKQKSTKSGEFGRIKLFIQKGEKEKKEKKKSKCIN